MRTFLKVQSRTLIELIIKRRTEILEETIEQISKLRESIDRIQHDEYFNMWQKRICTSLDNLEQKIMSRKNKKLKQHKQTSYQTEYPNSPQEQIEKTPSPIQENITTKPKKNKQDQIRDNIQTRYNVPTNNHYEALNSPNFLDQTCHTTEQGHITNYNHQNDTREHKLQYTITI